MWRSEGEEWGSEKENLSRSQEYRDTAGPGWLPCRDISPGWDRGTRLTAMKIAQLGFLATFRVDFSSGEGIPCTLLAIPGYTAVSLSLHRREVIHAPVSHFWSRLPPSLGNIWSRMVQVKVSPTCAENWCRTREKVKFPEYLRKRGETYDSKCVWLNSLAYTRVQYPVTFHFLWNWYPQFNGNI